MDKTVDMHLLSRGNHLLSRTVDPRQVLRSLGYGDTSVEQWLEWKHVHPMIRDDDAHSRNLS